jgi:hypothetical protein
MVTIPANSGPRVLRQLLTAQLFSDYAPPGLPPHKQLLMSDRLYAMKTALDGIRMEIWTRTMTETRTMAIRTMAMRTTISSVLAGVIHRRDSCPIRVGCNAIVTFLFLFFHFSHARMLSRILSHTPFDTSPPTAQR